MSYLSKFLYRAGTGLLDFGGAIFGQEEQWWNPDWYNRPAQKEARAQARRESPIWQSFNKNFGEPTWEDEGDFSFADVMDIKSSTEGEIQGATDKEGLQLALLNFLKGTTDWNDDEIGDFLNNADNWKDLIGYDPNKAVVEKTEGTRNKLVTAESQVNMSLEKAINDAQQTTGFTDVSYGDTQSKAISDAFAYLDPYKAAYSQDIAQAKEETGDEFWDLMEMTTNT